ncbi:hypothetical protein [Arachidicoccus terrestris]|uniref:hypothetical protein n=1 Tax=Arachidicoccus terrestris TaxID=2875539 RepID=UPI001CC76E8E|nr:hypothetical protein [Arachidicoccus terrestris]UAY56931.1 hypothetical protein K9M52_08070 [Arachidicoccus terrestris]
MKRFVSSFLFITAAIGLIISCQKNRDVSVQDVSNITAQELSVDSDFNQYSDNYNALVDSILKNFNRDQIEDLISKIELAKTQNMSLEEQYTFLAKEFKLSDKQTLIKAT